MAADEKITIGAAKMHPGVARFASRCRTRRGFYRGAGLSSWAIGYTLLSELGPDEFAKSKAVDEYLKSFTIEE